VKPVNNATFEITTPLVLIADRAILKIQSIATLTSNFIRKDMYDDCFIIVAGCHSGCDNRYRSRQGLIVRRLFLG
jgi:hypothetical protein